MENASNAWPLIVARCWHDHAFRNRLLEDPASVLRAQGIDVAAGIEVRVVEDTEERLHLTLPAKPIAELSEEALDAVTGGAIVTLVNNLSKVFGWSPKQVDQILGRGGLPYTGGSGDLHTSSDTGAE